MEKRLHIVSDHRIDKWVMEADGVLALFTLLTKKNLLKRVHAFVLDKDTKVSKLIKTLPNTEHIRFYYDPGHVSKNFRKSLNLLFGKAKAYMKKMETSKEKSYKNERRHMQPLEVDEEITTELLSCLFKDTGCSHKGFKRKKCLENHIA